MSEYWKSTPRYWCKHCKVFVRDTKLEKSNHDATPRHQGNLKRFVRDLHKGHEKEEKDKERARSEVARLNGIVSGSGTGSSGSNSSSAYERGPTPAGPKAQVTPSQRKQQLAQLAEMGVAIPDEFRGEMAMAGEWHVTAERVVNLDEEKNSDAIGFGVRKRPALDDEEEQEEAMEAKRRRWGNAHKTHPIENDEADLDALLSNTLSKAKTVVVEEGPTDPGIKYEATELLKKDDKKYPGIKNEPLDEDRQLHETGLLHRGAELDVKHEEGGIPGGIVFKKRKPKAVRQR